MLYYSSSIHPPARESHFLMLAARQPCVSYGRWNYQACSLWL